MPVVGDGLYLPVFLHGVRHTIHPLSDLLHYTTFLLGHQVPLGLCRPGPSVTCVILLVDVSGVASLTRQSLVCGGLTYVQHGPATPASSDSVTVSRSPLRSHAVAEEMCCSHSCRLVIPNTVRMHLCLWWKASSLWRCLCIGVQHTHTHTHTHTRTHTATPSEKPGRHTHNGLKPFTQVVATNFSKHGTFTAPASVLPHSNLQSISVCCYFLITLA